MILLKKYVNILNSIGFEVEEGSRNSFEKPGMEFAFRVSRYELVKLYYEF